MKRIFCVGLDTFSRKNIIQVEAAYSGGFFFDVFCNDSREKSEQVFAPFKAQGSKIYCVKNNLLQKLFLFIKCLVTENYIHVELYPAGRMGFLYAVILKLLRKRFYVIERGDIGCIDDYNKLTKFSIFLSYKLATGVIYREVYMEELLLNHGVKRLYFLPNCVPEPPHYRVIDASKKAGFLWVNRIIKQRRAHWLSKAFTTPALANEELDIVGFSSDEALTDPTIEYEIKALQYKSNNILFHALQEPFEFYNAKRFFCLPAELVFGNNSLLEAMSFGMIPIVTRRHGVELLIEDGINGIVTDMDEESYSEGLIKASRLTDEQVFQMSQAARNTVLMKYNVKQWTKQLLEIYERH